MPWETVQVWVEGQLRQVVMAGTELMTGLRTHGRIAFPSGRDELVKDPKATEPKYLEGWVMFIRKGRVRK